MATKKTMRKMKLGIIITCMLLIESIFLTMTVTAIDRPTTPEGPDIMVPNQVGIFSTSYHDEEDLDIYLKWEFWDARADIREFTDWLGPYPDDTELEFEFSFPTSTCYRIRVKAKDTNEEESSWSGYHSLIISVPPILTVTGPSEARPLAMITIDWMVTDPDPQVFQQKINWGDGNQTTWGGKYNPGTHYMKSHFYTDVGNYIITVEVRERWKVGVAYWNGWEADETHEIEIIIEPPSNPVIEGPESGFVGTSYTFEATSTGVEGDVIQYLFDWGDGNDTYWIPEDGLPEGQTINVSHAWQQPGTHTIRVKARETRLEYETDWVEYDFYINYLQITSFSGGFGAGATIENIGTISKDVTWKLEATGGVIPGFHINEVATGTIEPLDPGESQTVRLPAFLGLGGFKLTVTTECPGGPVVTKTVNGFCLFFYVFIM